MLLHAQQNKHFSIYRKHKLKTIIENNELQWVLISGMQVKRKLISRSTKQIKK